MANKRISVTKETVTGKNIKFHDNYTNNSMTKSEFTKAIENNKNNYQDKYHIRIITESLCTGSTEVQEWTESP